MIEPRSANPARLVDLLIQKQINDLQAAIDVVELDIDAWRRDIDLLNYEISLGVPDPRTGLPSWPGSWLRQKERELGNKQRTLANGLVGKKSLEGSKRFWERVAGKRSDNSSHGDSTNGQVVAYSPGVSSPTSSDGASASELGFGSHEVDTGSGGASDSNEANADILAHSADYDYVDESGNPVHVTAPASQPDPNGAGTGGFRGVGFLDDALLRTARVEGGYVSGRVGPIHAIYDDSSETSGVSDEIDIGGLDPLAPLAGGEFYDPRRHGPRRSAGSGRLVSYAEGLYPEGTRDDQDNETVLFLSRALADRPLAPSEPGSPQSLGAGIVAVSAGVTRTTRNRQ